MCVFRWQHREPPVYMATRLLARDAWSNQDIEKRTRNVSSWPDTVSLRVDSDLSDRNLMKCGIGFTQKMAEVSSPLSGYIDRLPLHYIPHVCGYYYELCGNGFYSLPNIESNKSKCCLALLPETWVPD